jgi:adenylate kinase family enzyme
MIRRHERKGVVVLGGPGTGKTTLLDNLIKRGVPIQHVSMSKLLTEASTDQALCLRIREDIVQSMRECRLVGDETTLMVFLRNFSRGDFLMTDQHHFFDGAPRTRKQTEQIFPVLHSKYGTGGVHLLALEAPSEICFQRMLTRRRPGETEEGIHLRLLQHKQESSGVIQYLVGRGIPCHTINTDQDEDQTLEEALGVCYKIGLS